MAIFLFDKPQFYKSDKREGESFLARKFCRLLLRMCLQIFDLLTFLTEHIKERVNLFFSS